MHARARQPACEAIVQRSVKIRASWRERDGSVKAVTHVAEEDLLCETVMELWRPLPRWSSDDGRATLVGDAAAPISHNLAQVYEGLGFRVYHFAQPRAGVCM